MPRRFWLHFLLIAEGCEAWKPLDGVSTPDFSGHRLKSQTRKPTCFWGGRLVHWFFLFLFLPPQAVRAQVVLWGRTNTQRSPIGSTHSGHRYIWPLALNLNFTFGDMRSCDCLSRLKSLWKDPPFRMGTLLVKPSYLTSASSSGVFKIRVPIGSSSNLFEWHLICFETRKPSCTPPCCRTPVI